MSQPTEDQKQHIRTFNERNERAGDRRVQSRRRDAVMATPARRSTDHPGAMTGVAQTKTRGRTAHWISAVVSCLVVAAAVAVSVNDITTHRALSHERKVVQTLNAQVATSHS